MEKKLPNFYKLLFSIAIPITLQNLLQTFVNMMDTVMVGRLGSVEIAAVGLGNQIFFLLNMVLFGISSGGSIFTSQYWGARDFAGIKKTLGLVLSASLFFAAIFTIGGLFFPETLIGLYSTDEKVIQTGAQYLRIAAISYPLMAITFSLQMIYRSTEHVILPMVSTAISFAVNIVFNRLFIFGFEPLNIPAYGATGAAIGTLISRSVEILITISYGKIKKLECIGTMAEMLSYDTGFVMKVFRVALPVLLSETLWGLGITTQNSIFAHAGTDSFAAFSIMNTVNQLTWVIFIGMGNASGIILGKKIGAGLEEDARRYANRYSWFMPLTGLLIGTLLIPISKTLPLIFNVEPEIIRISQTLLKVLVFLYPSRAFNMLIIVGICRSGGDTIFASIIDNGWMWLLSIPLGCIATFVLNLPAWQIMLCLETEQILKTLCGLWRVKSGKWLRNVVKEK